VTASARIIEPDGVEGIYLHPGQMYFCDRPSRVETVLGSCVAVTMWNPRLRIGCICHAVLPRRRASGEDPWKYVDSSIHSMIALLERNSSRRTDLEVKLFGGASMRRPVPNHKSVGSQNVDVALSLLHDEGFTPLISDTGGTSGRKLLFYSATGEVYLKRIPMEAGGRSWR
jgi:chemotaxis protein CheD